MSTSCEEPGSIEGLERLRSFMAFNQGFGLVFVFVDPSDTSDWVDRQLQQLGKGLILYPEPEMLTESAHQLAMSPPTDVAYVLFYANYIGPRQEKYTRNLMGRLNEQRDVLRSRLTCTLVVALPRLALEVRDFAPDLWSVRDLVVFLDAPSKPVVQVKQSEAQVESVQLLSADPPDGIPEELWRALGEKRLLLLLGPDLGIQGIPSPTRFLERVANDLRADGLVNSNHERLLQEWITNPSDQPRIAKLLCDLDRYRWFEYLEQAYDPLSRKIDVPPWVSTLASLGFQGILTFGFDLLLQDVLPTWKVFSWHDEAEMTDAEYICWLHGRADRPSSVVWSQDQYQRFNELNGPLLLFLRTQLLKFKVLALGFSGYPHLLDEFYALAGADRHQIFVAGSYDERFVSLCATDEPGFWVTRLAEGFQTKTDSYSSEMEPTEALWLEIPSASLARGLPPDVEEVRSFYRGAPVNWQLVKQGHCLEREALFEILNLLATEKSQVVLLHGPVGEGKSTLLKQVGLALIDEYCVLEVQSCTGALAATLKHRNDKLVLLVDNAEKYHTQLDDLMQFTMARQATTKLIMVARTNEWRRFQGHLDKSSYIEVTMAPLSLAEGDRLAHLIVCAGANLGHINVPQLSAAISSTRRSFLSTMLTATAGRQLVNKLGSVLDRMKQFDEGHQFIEGFCLLAATDQMARTLEEKLTCSLRLMRIFLNVSARGFQGWLQTLQGVMNLQFQDGAFSLPHPEISNLIWPLLFNETGFMDELLILERLLRCVATPTRYFAKDEENYITIVPRYLKAQQRWDQARTMYRIVCDLRPQDAAHWHEWAMLEMREGNWGTLDHPDCARWLFRRATEVNPHYAPSWLEWAILERNADRFGSKEQPYSARWLFARTVEVDPSVARHWLNWALLESDAGNIGSVDQPQTARALFYKAIFVDPHHAPTWRAWALLEKKAGNLGSLKQPWSARWLIAKALVLDPKNQDNLSVWVELENLVDHSEEVASAPKDRSIIKASAFKPHALLAWAAGESLLANKNRLRTLVEAGIRAHPDDPTYLGLLETFLANEGSKPDDTLLITYHPNDGNWLPDLRSAIGIRETAIELWRTDETPQEITWEAGVGLALGKARVALFLLSPDFLASPYIKNLQLMTLLRAAERSGCRISWVLLRSCPWETSPLAHLPPVGTPTPLSVLTEEELKVALAMVDDHVQHLWTEPGAPRSS